MAITAHGHWWIVAVDGLDGPLTAAYTCATAYVCQERALDVARHYVSTGRRVRVIEELDGEQIRELEYA